MKDGMIEDQCLSALEIDFANRYLGGGVLGQGCVQVDYQFKFLYKTYFVMIVQ